jgi:hypothetical protein
MKTSLAETPQCFLVDVRAIVVSELDLNVDRYVKGSPFKARPAFSKGQKRNKDSPEQHLSRFRDRRFSRRGDGNHCLMIDFRVILVQLCRQALGLFLLEKLRPGSDLSTDGGLPKDSVRFHNTIRAF